MKPAICLLLVCVLCPGQYFPPGGASVAGGSVSGGDSLINPNSVPYVISAGTLAEMSGATWTDAIRSLLFRDVSNNQLIGLAADPGQERILSINVDGVAAPAVATTPGAPGGEIYGSGVGGGDTTIATTGVGGDGGRAGWSSGPGGRAASAAIASTGGRGGEFIAQTANGGNANEAANTGINTGGSGGRIAIISGAGGSAANGSSNTGGDGGIVFISLGSGGTGATSNGLDGSVFIVAGARANAPIMQVQSNTEADLFKIDASGDTVISQTLVTDGAAPTVGAGSCTGATIGTGSKMMAGTITGMPTGPCQVTLTFSVAAPTGWVCSISNRTTANITRQTASSTTVATFVGTTVSGDVLQYGPCMAY